MTSFFLDQHGCAKNQVDAEILISHLTGSGFVQTQEPSEANVIIVNTCGFIESAKKESLDAVINAKKNYPTAKILLTGCLAERYAKIFAEQLPEADGIFGNGDLAKITSVFAALEKGERPVLVPKQEGICCASRKSFLSFPGSAYVKLTEGCSNHCTFCAIPLIRGEVRSRPAKDIVSEINSLVKNGVYEINLIGQDVAAYGVGHDDNVFGTGRFPLPTIDKIGVNLGTEKASALSLLLKEISSLEGNFVLRLLYIHPDHFNRDILPVIKNDSRLLPYFDMPFQSGSTSIIHAMNRVGNANEYLRLVNDIRKIFPEAAIRTTFLTGFPGESEENAKQTCEFLKSIRSDWSGCFSYSREEDTPAYSLKNRVAKKIADERAAALVSIQEKITKEKLALRCGKDYDVLVEEIIPDEELAIARAWFQAPDVDGNIVVHYDSITQDSFVKPGSVIRVHANAVTGVDISAHCLGSVTKTNEQNSVQNIEMCSLNTNQKTNSKK